MSENTPPPSQPEKPKVVLKSTTPAQKDPARLISNYRKSQQIGPFIIWGAVVLFIFVGIVLLIVWLTSSNGPKLSIFSTETPTPTITPSPTFTSTFTPTATVTSTATITLTPTPDKPFEYVVQENDNVWDIANKFNLGALGPQLIIELNKLDPTNPGLNIGQKILIPDPSYKLPTATAIPSNLPPGTKLDYIIMPGDTIAGIASLFNSTADAILTENKITDANKIQVGQKIVVPVNIVTPTPAPRPTITPGPSPTPPSPFTATPAGGAAPTVSPTPTK